MPQIQLFTLPDEHPANRPGSSKHALPKYALPKYALPKYRGLALAKTLNATLRIFDSFDGRLHRAGLCLQEWHIATSPVTSSETRLIGNDGLVQQRIPQALALCAPESALQQALQSLVAPRALVLQAELAVTQHYYELRNKDSKLLARCTLSRYSNTAHSTLLTVFALDELRGYEEAAARLLAALQAVEPWSVCTDYIAQLYRLAAIEPNQYSVKPCFILTPEQPARAALRQVLAWLLKVMDANTAGLKQDLDSEFLHDFRIAIRRTRSLLGAFKQLFPNTIMQHYHTEFARLGQASGPTRDLDVYLLEIPTFEKQLPAALATSLAPLRDYLQRQQKREQRRLVRVLDSARCRKLLDDWRSFLSQAETPEQTSPLLHEIAGERIWRAYRKARRQGSAITPDSPAESLHELRKTCKKLRYLLDGLPGLYPEDALAAALKPLKTLQRLLGDFQDCSVQAEHLESYAQALRKDPKVPVETFMALGVLVDHLERRGHELRAQFAEEFAGFASPDSKRLFRNLTL